MQLRIISLYTFIFLILSVCLSTTGHAQESPQRLRSIGIGYYGELGLHPGIQADLSIELADNSTRRFKQRKLLLRPSLIYFRRQFYSNNYIVMPQLISQISAREFGSHMLYFEISGKVGYHRFQYIGDQYITTPTGIQTIKRQGGNGMVYGLGFLLGVKSQSTRYYYLSMDYLTEKGEDSIRPNLIALKLGVRFDKTRTDKTQAR